MGAAKVLIVTSRLAYKVVKDVVDRAVKEGCSRYDVDILELPVDVAALVTTEYIAKYLRSVGITKGMYDLIVVPGLARGSCRVIEEATGIKAVKGCTHAADIRYLLEVELSELSSERPADDILRKYIKERVTDVLRRVEEKVASEASLRVGAVAVPTSPPPMRVISEIPKAHLLKDEELIKVASRLVREGADILSVGFEAYSPHPDRVAHVVKVLKEEVGAPVAIDSIIPSEIIEGVRAGADLVLSLTRENIPKVAEYVREVPAVVIPQQGGSVLREPGERIKLLESNIDLARSHGLEELVGDLVMEPPIAGGTLASLIAYYEFKRRHPEIPLLMGVGNVTELVDADSVGVNATLAFLALEAGASLLLTVEKSAKAKGSTMELAIAAQMSSLAWFRKSPPKDLGVDLLILKDKVSTPVEFRVSGKVELVDVSGEVSANLKHTGFDPAGIFKIRVSHDEGVIEALYMGRKGLKLIRGRDAKSIMQYIISNGLVSELSHAAYLGSELTKAEEALVLGKNYIQEQPLFTKKSLVKVREGR